MTLSNGLLTALVLAGCLYWWHTARRALRARRAVPVLRALAPPAPAAWPRVSLIVTACNEADVLEAAVRSRLGDDYPDLEVVLVDDRSTDGTGAIVDRLAAADPRVVPVHITALPPGWLGKVHAMHEGVARATGRWLLFSDADVHFAPGTLRRAVAFCEARGVDHLSALPSFAARGVWLDAVLAAFLRGACAGIDLARVADPGSRAAAGAGLFNLVRRTAFDATPGLAWLKLEVGDDVALGQMLKAHGARAAVVNASGLVSLEWYRSVGEMAVGLEKNGFAIVGRYSVSRLLLGCAVYLALELGPFLGLAAAGLPWLQALSAATLAAGLAAHVAMARWLGRPALPTLLAPLGALTLAAFLLRSGALAVRRGGIVWRSTLYPTAMLREGVRLRWP